MKKIIKSLLFSTLILFACSPNISPSLQPEQPTGPKIIVTVGTPHVDQGPKGDDPATSSETCAFAWAQHPLEELTVMVDTAVKELEPQASAHASAFGEDCIYPSGRKVFFSIETDFYILLPVEKLDDLESFGNWIAQTMPVVNSMPPDMVEGPRSGFVEYQFTDSANEKLTVRVPIQEYNEIAQGKTGTELFQLFATE